MRLLTYESIIHAAQFTCRQGSPHPVCSSGYAAAQTVTTVDYNSDVTPATRMLECLQWFFMLAGVGAVLYALTVTVHGIVQSELVATFRERRGKMSKLTNHFIVAMQSCY